MPALRQGAAAVEFAVVAPLFFLLVAGILEFGQAFRIQHALSTAARHGARAATLQGATSSQISEKVVKNCVSLLGVAATDVTVGVSVNGQLSVDLSQAKGGNEVSVAVSIPYSKAGVGFYANTFAKSTLKSTCTMEKE